MKKEFIFKLIELYCYVFDIYDTRLAYLVQRFSNNCSPKFTNQYSAITENIVDSFLIALSKDKRTFRGKVAPELCNKGYCATKDFHYYGS